MFAQRSLGEDVNQSQAFEQLQIYSKARPYLNICKAVTNKTVMICHLCWAVRGARQCDVSGLGSLHWLSAMPGFAMRHGFLPMTKDFGFPYRPNGWELCFLRLGFNTSVLVFVAIGLGCGGYMDTPFTPLSFTAHVSRLSICQLLVSVFVFS